MVEIELFLISRFSKTTTGRDINLIPFMYIYIYRYHMRGRSTSSIICTMFIRNGPCTVPEEFNFARKAIM